MATWILLRHGQSVANAARRLAGWDDVGLTEFGRLQARGAGQALRAHPLDLVLSSELQRASQTAHLALEAWSGDTRRAPEVVCHAALRERRLGVLQGVSLSEARRTGALDPLRTWTGVVEGSESQAALCRRVLDCLKAYDDVDGTVLLVAHGGVIRGLRGLLDDLDHAHIGNTRVANATPLLRVLKPGTWGRLARELRA